MTPPSGSLDLDATLEAHGAWLGALARALCADPHAADDAVQETLLATAQHPPAPERPVRPWLAAVLRNFVRRGRRGAARRAAREHAAARREALADTPDELVARLEVQRRVAEAVHALPEPYRSTLLARYMEGLAPAELAARSGESAGTVRSRIHRGLALLRAALDARHGGDRDAWLLLLAPTAARAASRVTRRPAASALAAAAGVAVVVAAALLLARGPVPDDAAPASARHAPVGASASPARDAASPESRARTRAPSSGAGPNRRAEVAADAPDEELPARVVGRVADTAGRWLEGARVAVRAEPGCDDVPDVLTGREGRFELPRVDVGARCHRVLEIAAAGYEPFAFGINVYPGELTDGVSPVLSPLVPAEVGVAGVVRGPDGTPLAGIEVRYAYEHELAGAMGSEETDDEGRFAIPDALGRCVLAAHDPEERFGDVFLDDAPIGADDVELRFPRPREVHVRLVDEGGGAVPDFVVTLQHPGEEYAYAELEADEGAVTFLAPSGTVVVEADAPGCSLATLGPIAGAELARAPERTLRVSRLAGVTGRLVLASGEALGGAQVLVVRPVAPGVAAVVDGFRSRLERDVVTSAASDADGSFALTLRDAGDYALLVRESGRTRAEIALALPDPRAGRVLGDVRIEPAASLSGTVYDVDGAPLPEGVVAFSRGDAHVFTVVADESGRYAAAGLAPGAWQVRLVDDEVVEESWWAEWLRGTLPPPTPTCTVVAGRHERHDVHQSGRCFAVDVRLERDGAVIADAIAELRADDGEQLAVAELGELGTYELGTHREGEHLVRVATRDGALVAEDRVLCRAALQRCTLSFATGTLDVRVPPDAGELAVVQVTGPSRRLVLRATPDADGVLRMRAPLGPVRVARRGVAGSDPATWETLVDADAHEDAETD